MLQSNIQIFANVLTLTHHPQQIHRKVCRIGIVQAYPLYPVNIRNPFNKLSNMLFPVDVYSIVSQLLGNHLEFLYALRD